MLAFLAGVSVVALAAEGRADTPDGYWNAPWVQVKGGDPALAGAINNGLREANQTYFYGDRATKMVATIKGDAVDLTIVDQTTGKVLARQGGLSIGGSDVSSSIKNAALAWMDGLSCGANCADASGSAPAVKVAVAPVEEELKTDEAPEVTEADSADEVAVKEAPVEGKSPEEAPVEEAPVEKAAIEETSIDEAPVEETAVEKAPIEITPVETAPDETEPKLAVVAPDDTRAVALPKGADDDARKLSPVPEEVEKPSVAVTPVSEPKAADNVVIAAAPVIDDAPETSGSPDTGLKIAPQPKPRIRLPEPTAVTAGTPAALAVLSDAPTGGTSDGAPDLIERPKTGTGEERLAAVTPTPPAPEIKAPDLKTPEAKSPEVKTPTVTATTVAAPEVKAPVRPKSETRDVAPEVKTPSIAVETLAEDTVAKAPPADAATDTEVASVDAATAADTPRADITPGVSLPIPRPRGLSVAAAAPAADVTTDASAAAASGTTEKSTAAEGTGESASAGTDVAAVDPDEAAATFKPNEVEAEKDAALAAELDAKLPAVDEEIKTAAAPADEVLTVPGAADAAAGDAEPADGANNGSVAPDAATTDGAAETSTGDPVEKVETKVAAVDPTDEGPTLANARWIGFTPAVFTGADSRSGAWISGPFDRKQRVGWITDTATGATTRVKFIWREAGTGNRTAVLSQQAAKALGLSQGDVANVAVYLPR